MERKSLLNIKNDNFNKCSTSSFNRSEHINSLSLSCVFGIDAMEACHFTPVYIGVAYKAVVMTIYIRFLFMAYL